jgi:hypothetical protein
MNGPAASDFKRRETLRANIELSLTGKDQGSRQDAATGPVDLKAALIATFIMRRFTKPVKHFSLVCPVIN